jgi:hypothetical protein
MSLPYEKLLTKPTKRRIPIEVAALFAVSNADNVRQRADESAPDPQPSMRFALAVAAAVPLPLTCGVGGVLSWENASVSSVSRFVFVVAVCEMLQASEYARRDGKNAFVSEASTGFALRELFCGRMLRGAFDLAAPVRYHVIPHWLNLRPPAIADLLREFGARFFDLGGGAQLALGTHASRATSARVSRLGRAGRHRSDQRTLAAMLTQIRQA